MTTTEDILKMISKEPFPDQKNINLLKITNPHILLDLSDKFSFILETALKELFRNDVKKIYIQTPFCLIQNLMIQVCQRALFTLPKEIIPSLDLGINWDTYNLCLSIV
jgi:hypothetical protein